MGALWVAKSRWTLLLGLLLLAGCGGGGEADRPLPRLNDEPVLSPVGNRIASPGETVTITLSASDPEGDPLAFRAEGLPAGATFDPSSATFTWTPGAGAAGIHYLAFVVADPGSSDFETVAITVPAGTPPSSPGGTIFAQSIPARDQDGDLFPGQGNVWDLAADLSLDSGGDAQFEGAMALSVGPANALGLFPDLTYADLSWAPPYFSQGDGVITVAISGSDTALSGSASARLNGTSDSRLQQTVDLSTAPGGALTLTWVDEDLLDRGNFEAGTYTGELASYDLVLRDSQGIELRRRDISDPSSPPQADLSEFAGEKIEISFEARNSSYGFIAVDDVSLRDASGREYIVNGDFESGDLRGWKTNFARESQNISTSPRPVGDLEVTRAFFTHPSRKWGRWVDVFENRGGTAADVTVRYTSTLGAYIDTTTNPVLGTARIYPTPETEGALSIWDATEFLKRTGALAENVPGTRDVGFVFGDMRAEFISRGNTAGLPPSPVILLERAVSVPPGSRRAVVTFVILDVVDTGESAENLNALASGVDAVNRAIARDFWTDPQYREGMPDGVSEEQIENF